jgi:O-antigen/teichoic acid export membrane protein
MYTFITLIPMVLFIENVISNLILIPKHKLLGVKFSTFISYSAICFIQIVCFVRIQGINPFRLFIFRNDNIIFLINHIEHNK